MGAKIIKTTHDGWGCVPELREVLECLDYIKDDEYEIRNCVRNSTLPHLVENLRDNLQDAIDILDGINVNKEFETVDDDDEDVQLEKDIKNGLYGEEY